MTMKFIIQIHLMKNTLCRLIISYIAKIIDLNIDCKPLINKVGINGSDLILLKKNSGISGLNLSELKLVSKKAV